MAYKTIQESFWTDLKVRKLTPNDKLMFLYLITNPHAHYSGLYYLPVTFMSEEVGLPVKTIQESLERLSKSTMIQYDNLHSVVWVIKMCQHQMAQGGNPKVLKSGIVKNLGCLQSKGLVKEFIEYYHILNLTLPQGWNNVDETLLQRTDTDTDTDTDKKEDKDNINNNKGKGKKKPELFPIPDDFKISDAVKRWAEEKGYGDISKHFDNFIDTAKSRKYQYADWDAALRRAIRDNWAKIPVPIKSEPASPSVLDKIKKAQEEQKHANA